MKINVSITVRVVDAESALTELDRRLIDGQKAAVWGDEDGPAATADDA